MSDVVVGDVRIPMRDGLLLAADVIRPMDAVLRSVLLIRTPYSRGAMRLVHDVVGLARSGWSVVVQDVRGRFDSQGTFTAFAQEVDDGYDTVDWCSKQAWSDGRVAMIGMSYVGATQWLAARSGHPALLAINPVVGAGDIDQAMLHEGGAFQLGLVQPWVLGLAASDPYADQVHRERAGMLGARWPELLRAAPGADPVADLLPTYAAWRRGETGPGHDLGVQAAAFQVAGWYDIFCESALRHWAAQEAMGRPQRLVIGPWSHSNGLSNIHPELDFGGDANGAYEGVLGSAMDWMRRVLDGHDVPSGISCYVMGEGWRELPSWPPPARDLTLHWDDARLAPEPSPQAVPVPLSHNPVEPVPTMGGRVLGPFLPLPGPVDQRPVEGRPDVAVFTGAVLADPLPVVGRVSADVEVESTGRSLDVCVTLSDVHPDGRSFHVLDGIRRVSSEPGERMVVRVDVGSIAHSFGTGHRVRLRVSGSCFPRFDVNPSTGEPPGAALRLERAVNTVHPAGSFLRLPICPLTQGS